MVILGAKLYFMTGNSSHHSVGTTYHFKATNLPKLFVAGRTFEALRKYYCRDNKTSYEPFVDRAIEMYCQVTSRAREATIQTLLILKELGVMKDIRLLIAKLVYASRVEVEWYTPFR